LEKPRTSPRLSDEQVEHAQDTLAQLQCETETAARETLATLPLFPPKFSYPGVSEGHDELWNSRAVPHIPGSGRAPVSTPKPDRYYGYKDTAFDLREYAIISHRALNPYAQPGTTSYWPFFPVEFKAQSRGGTFWVGVNQNAANGAHILRSIEALRHHSQADEDTQLGNHVFSCVIDTTDAALWVHWVEAEAEDKSKDGYKSHHSPPPSPPSYHMAEVAHYHLSRPDDLRVFHASVRNILDHAVGIRLVQIRTLLAAVSVDDLERGEKARRTRQFEE
jgi:hypothetical protein